MACRTSFVVIVLTLIPPPVLANAAEPTTQPAEKVQLVYGQLFNSFGGGVEGAVVTLRGEHDDRVYGTATTDAYGDFSIDSEKPVTGHAHLTFEKKYFKTVKREVELGGEDGPPFVDHQMAGAIVLAGTVQDDLKREPVAGANVKAETWGQEWSVTTGEDGAFAIENLAPGPLSLTVEAEGFARAQYKIERAEEADLHVVLLKPERIVHLLVTDEANKSIGGANVELENEQHDYRHLITDAEGKVTVNGLSLDDLRLMVRLTDERHVSSMDFDRPLDLPRDDTESSFTLVMKQAGVVVGTITDVASGEPQMGARISAGEVADELMPRCWSEVDGTYRLIGVAPGKAVITVYLAGHAPQLASVDVTAGGEAKLDFAMQPAREIVGKVMDEEGKSLPGVYIRATKWQGYDTLSYQAMSNEEGEFTFLDGPEDSFEIALYAQGYEPLVSQTIGGDHAGKSAATFTMNVDERAGKAPGPALAVGDDAPDFKVTTLAGDSIQISDLRGKFVLVDFWATWCGPCVGEVPNLLDTYKSFGISADFVMLSVSLDQDMSALKSFVAARKMQWHHAGGPDSGASEAADAYRVQGIPSIYLIGPDGKIAATQLRGAALQQAVETALDNKLHKR